MDPTATIIIVALFIGLAIIAWWLITPKHHGRIEYKSTPETWSYSFHTFKEISPFNAQNLTAEGQSPQWRERMHRVGSAMSKENLKHVYFVHGTFAGHDPWGIVETLKIIYPSIPKTLAETANRLSKKGVDQLIKDSGNFTKEYVDIFRAAINHQITCELFHWSSANHHIARLKGAVNLLYSMADRIQHFSSSDRLLLVGHSHAGQMFALITVMATWDFASRSLVKIAGEAGEDPAKIWRALEQVNKLTIDYVTLGTPPSYAWADSGYYRLLNIINHRGNTFLAGSLKGLLTTKSGDYIQQLGILGSDLIAATAHERRLNRKLDEILGEGSNIRLWSDLIKHKMRVPPHGRTFLVNYGDNAAVPNFHQTFFGHGIYTKYHAMLYLSIFIGQFFYGLTNDEFA